MYEAVAKHIAEAEKARQDARELRSKGYAEAARIADIRERFHLSFAKIEEASNEPSR